MGTARFALNACAERFEKRKKHNHQLIFFCFFSSKKKRRREEEKKKRKKHPATHPRGCAGAMVMPCTLCAVRLCRVLSLRCAGIIPFYAAPSHPS